MEFDNDIINAIKTLRNGGVILYPTDTIWGLGCDATNEKAVARIYDIKRRAEAKSMLSLIGSIGMLERYVDNVPDIAYQLINAAVKPLTIIYDEAIGFAPNIICADGSVGIRITTEAFSNKLCIDFGKPIVSTSANISNKPAPHFFDEIDFEIVRQVDYVVGYRQTDRIPANPSNIIKLSSDGTFKLIR